MPERSTPKTLLTRIRAPRAALQQGEAPLRYETGRHQKWPDKTAGGSIHANALLPETGCKAAVGAGHT